MQLNSPELILEFKQHIAKNFPYLLEQKCLVACSGGLDSVVLTHLMKSLNPTLGLAHCNFSLRGKESDGDEMFVIGLAKYIGVPVYAETFDTELFAKTNGVSTQMAARTLRYEWFGEIMENFKYDYLLTAHHLDDDLETFFINLSRGTGISGLTGIPPKNGNIIRPLLPFSREQILTYAESNNLKWREDSSNQKPDYLRNNIRLRVLPKFKEINDSVLRNFKTTQKNLQASRSLIEDYMALIYNLAVVKDGAIYRINIQKLREIPNTEALLYELLHGFGFTEWNDISSLLFAQTGKQLFSITHTLLKNRDELLLKKIDSTEVGEEFLVSEEGIDFPIELKINLVEEIGDTGKDTIYVAAEKLKFPLKLRKWREGDSFRPFGLNGKKKVSKFFKDEKLSRIEKERIWLLLSDGRIVWIVGFRMDDYFKVEETTEKIIQISTRDVR